MEHADYPHEPGTLYGCAACEPILRIQERHFRIFGIPLEDDELIVIDGEPTIDGMPAEDWLDAMEME